MVKVIVAKGVKCTVVKDVTSRNPKALAKAVYTGPLDPEDSYDEEPEAQKPKKTEFRKYAITAPEQAKEKRPTYMGYNWNTAALRLFHLEADVKRWKKHELAERPYAAVYIGKIIQ